MLVPLYGFVEGDTMGVLVLARADMPIGIVADKLRDSTALRVGPGDAWELSIDGHVLDRARTVQEAGIKPLARVDLRRRDRDSPVD